MTALLICWTAVWAAGAPAVVFDARGLTWEERCTVEALQGLVNRRGARLFLDFGYAWDRKWLEIYAERYGMRYEEMVGMGRLLERFGREAKGMVVYDPQVDGSRYVAITLAGVEGLLPVAPNVLEGRSPGLISGEQWAGIDFAKMPGAEELIAGQAGAEARVITGKGLEVRQVSRENPWGFVTIGPVRIDMDEYPYLEVEVAEVGPKGAKWGVKLTWDRNRDGQISGPEDDLVLPVRGEKTGTFRWNVAKMAGLHGPHVFWRIQLHALGWGAKVVFRSVRFVSAEGEGPKVPPVVGLRELLKLPVKYDLRGRFHDSVAAYRWALREVMPRCDRRFAHAVNGTVDGIRAGGGPFAGFDWPVMHRGFVFNLTCTAEKRRSYGESVVGGSRRQARMYRKILEALEPPAMITGYGEPEGYWCRLLSEHGHYSFHFGDNWSFHTHVKPKHRPARQKKQYGPVEVKLEADKFYVCVMTSEGDTMKGPIPFFFGSWFDQDRGKVAINWGINPLMGRYFPAMLEYYYETASDGDYFFAGCSGAGYCYPEYMPNLRQFAEHTRRACEAADIRCVDLWGARSRNVLQEYADVARPLGMTVNIGRALTQILRGGVPVVGQPLMYWQNKATGTDRWQRVFADEKKRAEAIRWLAERIEEIAARHYPPFVILVYSDLHSYAHHCRLAREIRDALDPARFEVVRVDYALAGLREWAKGKVLVGNEGVNERLAWAAIEGGKTKVGIRLTNAAGRSADVRVWTEVGGRKVGEAKVRLKPWESRRVEGMEIETSNGAEKARVIVETRDQRAEYEAEICAVPVGAGVRQAELAAVWDGVSLHHAGGEAVRDAEALWGMAWAAEVGKDKVGHIVYGPYAELGAGHYLVAFRLKLTQPAAAETNVARIDVFAGGELARQKTVAEKELKAGDFRKVGQWQWFVLEADWAGPPDMMETRVWWEGKAGLAVDRVAVFRIGQAG